MYLRFKRMAECGLGSCRVFYYEKNCDPIYVLSLKTLLGGGSREWSTEWNRGKER